MYDAAHWRGALALVWLAVGAGCKRASAPARRRRAAAAGRRRRVVASRTGRRSCAVRPRAVRPTTPVRRATAASSWSTSRPSRPSCAIWSSTTPGAAGSSRTRWSRRCCSRIPWTGAVSPRLADLVRARRRRAHAAPAPGRQVARRPAVLLGRRRLHHRPRARSGGRRRPAQRLRPGLRRRDARRATPSSCTLTRPAPFLKQALAHLAILPQHLLRGQRPAPRRGLARARRHGAVQVRLVEGRATSWCSRATTAYWGQMRTSIASASASFATRRWPGELYRRGELDVLWQVPPTHFDEARSDAEARRPSLLVVDAHAPTSSSCGTPSAAGSPTRACAAR